MKITYIGHSGFFVELERTWLLFDYYNGQIPKLPDGKKGYVFSSHRHPDHFNPDIFRLAEQQPDIQFILSYDIWKKKVPEALREQTVHLKPDKNFEAENLWVHTLLSTDEGVAFLVNVEDKAVYHAGDLNDWRWKEESEAWNEKMAGHFRKFIEPLRGRKLDAAFVPLDPRQEEYYALGMDYFLELTDTQNIYPMHFWEHPEIIERWLAEHKDSPYCDRMVKVKVCGEVFEQ